MLETADQSAATANSLAEPDDAYLDLLGTGTFGIAATAAFKNADGTEISITDNEFVSLFSDELSNNPYFTGVDSTGKMREPNAYWVPRPAFFIRLLLFASLALLVTMTALAAIVSRQLQQRIGDVGAEVQSWSREQLPTDPLPDPELLADSKDFTQALLDHPERQSELHRNQAGWLLTQGKHAQASEHFRLARITSKTPATMSEWLQEIDCWISYHQLQKARNQLGRLLQGQLSQEDISLIQARLGRIALHERRYVRSQLKKQDIVYPQQRKPQQTDNEVGP